MITRIRALDPCDLLPRESLAYYESRVNAWRRRRIRKLQDELYEFGDPVAAERCSDALAGDAYDWAWALDEINARAADRRWE